MIQVPLGWVVIALGVIVVGLGIAYFWFGSQLHRAHELRAMERRGRIKVEQQLKEMMKSAPALDESKGAAQAQDDGLPPIAMEPIGVLTSVYKTRNGTPRQGLLVPSSRAVVHLVSKFNPQYALEGLQGFSHCWLVFYMHKNTNAHKPTARFRSKVKPPRLGGGQTLGVFATRTPHRVSFHSLPVLLSALCMVA